MSRRASPDALVLSCSPLSDHTPPAVKYDMRACCGAWSKGIGVTRLSIVARRPCGDAASLATDTARNCFWLLASAAAKLVRASMVLVENQLLPCGHPATFGGSKSCWPIAAIGDRALSSAKFCQPTSLIDRTTNSAGHE